MKIIYKYLIKTFLGPFALTFVFADFILLMQWLWKYVDDLVGKGLEIKYVLELLFYSSATMVPTAIPLAVLLSSLMTFGNLGEKYEIVAIKSSGISIKTMMLPLAILTLLISVGAFSFSNWVVPKAFVKMKTLLVDIQDQKPALNIEEGTFYGGFDKFTIRVGKKGNNNEKIEDVLIYDHSKQQGNTTMTYAKSGEMKMTPDKHYLMFLLYDGFFWDESKGGGKVGANKSNFPLTRGTFKEQYKRFDLSSFEMMKSDESFFEGTTMAMPVKELNKQVDTMKAQIKQLSMSASDHFFGSMWFYYNLLRPDNKPIPVADSVKPNYGLTELSETDQKKIVEAAVQTANNAIYAVNYSYDDLNFRNSVLWNYQIELHRKFTLAIACMLFFFIGAPMGSLIRKGGLGVPLVVTVLFFTFYFVISMIGEKVAKGSLIPVVAGMWFSSALLLPVCIFLTHKATEDSAVLSLEGYTVWFNKLIKKFKKR